MKRCKSCNAEITWLPTRNGGSMPVNTETLTLGEQAYTRRGQPPIFIYGKHESHFATCPDADKHRKRKRRNDDDRRLY